MDYDLMIEHKPPNWDDSEHYWIDNLVYMANIGWIIFMFAMLYSVLLHLKGMISYPLRIKMERM